jgi:hypothetical protein
LRQQEKDRALPSPLLPGRIEPAQSGKLEFGLPTIFSADHRLFAVGRGRAIALLISKPKWLGCKQHNLAFAGRDERAGLSVPIPFCNPMRQVESSWGFNSSRRLEQERSCLDGATKSQFEPSRKPRRNARRYYSIQPGTHRAAQSESIFRTAQIVP